MATINLQEITLTFINGGIPPPPDTEYRFYKCTLEARANYTCKRILYDDDKKSYNINTILVPISKNIPEMCDRAILHYKLTPRIKIAD